MSTAQLRRELKKAIDRLPTKQLESVDDFVRFLNRPSISRRLAAAEKAIAVGKGVNWRKVRSECGTRAGPNYRASARSLRMIQRQR
jgi:hypothetical protein